MAAERCPYCQDPFSAARERDAALARVAALEAQLAAVAPSHQALAAEIVRVRGQLEKCRVALKAVWAFGSHSSTEGSFEGLDDGTSTSWLVDSALADVEANP